MSVLVSINVENRKNDPFVFVQHEPHIFVGASRCQYLPYYVHAGRGAYPLSSMNSAIEEEQGLGNASRLDLEKNQEAW